MDKQEEVNFMEPSPKNDKIVIIAICGGSGSGKTTAARKLQAILGKDRCQILSQDNYYRDQTNSVSNNISIKINFDEPSSIDFSLMEQHLNQLKQGLSVSVPQYDLTTHKRKQETIVFHPSPIIIIDGILLLTQEVLRKSFSYSLFIDARESIRFARRLRRDVKERGRTMEEVQEQFSKFVKPMHDIFVEPSKKFATKIFDGENRIDHLLEEFSHEIIRKIT